MSQTLLTEHGILTRKQLSVILGVGEDTIARWEEEHGFPGRSAGKTTFYDVVRIKEWIAAKPKK